MVPLIVAVLLALPLDQSPRFVPLPSPQPTRELETIGRVKSRAFCTAVVTNANVVIAKVLANDATLDGLIDRLLHVDLDHVTDFERFRQVNHLITDSTRLQRSAADAQLNLKHIREAAQAVSDPERRRELGALAVALDRSLDGQRKIGVDLGRAVAIYQGRIGAAASDGNGASLDDSLAIETRRQMTDRFSLARVGIFASEARAAESSERATSDCVFPQPTVSPTKTTH